MRSLSFALLGLAMGACQVTGAAPDGATDASTVDAGRPDAGVADAGTRDAGYRCSPGFNSTCTAPPLSSWVLAGRCDQTGSCACLSGFHLEPSGMCAPDGDGGTPDGGWPLCEEQHPLDCAWGQAIWGRCTSAGICDCFATAEKDWYGRCLPSPDAGYFACPWGYSCSGDPGNDAIGYCPQESNECWCPAGYARDPATNRCYSDIACLTAAGFASPDGGALQLDAGTCDQLRCEPGSTCARFDAGAQCLATGLVPEVGPQFCFRPNCGSIICAQGCTCANTATSHCACP